FSIKKSLKNSCRRVIFGNVVCFNGDVVPCCFDKDAEFCLGNINENSLAEIRNSVKYKDFVAKVFSSRSEIQICKNCTE
ncbi:MAG: SPASM domain-containing protein, partial [Bacteroidales bacterium]|nr:SPASM domain-containing protein [Bacteroidales bacterium]